MNATTTPPPVEWLTPAPVLQADEVAALLRLSPGHFANRRRHLLQAGFPERLPGLMGWSRACVMRWIETNGQTFMPAEAPLEPVDGNALEERYGR